MGTSWLGHLAVFAEERFQQLCLRRLLVLSFFLLTWTICNAAPSQLRKHNSVKRSWSANDTLTLVNANSKRHQSINHVFGNSHGGCTKHRSNSRRNLGRNHHRHDRHNNNDVATPLRSHDIFNELRGSSNILNKVPSYVSDLVAFSAEKPTDLPWDNDNEITAARNKRSTPSGVPYHAVCASQKTWGMIPWAYDFLGVNVTIVDTIVTASGDWIQQWFHQTECVTHETSCQGIDHVLFESECEEKRSFVYAVIMLDDQRQGWDWIAINTSCNCAYRPFSF